ncbi:MAG: hypothetical protein Fur003_6390 [Candidatus Dojkabacteria bacterium]
MNYFSRQNSSFRLNKKWIPLYLVLALIIANLIRLTALLTPVLYFIFVPATYLGNKSGTYVKNIGETIREIRDLRNANNKLRMENYELKAQSELIDQLLQRNISLEKELLLGNKKMKKVEAEVIKYDPSGYLTLNLGSEDGVQKEDVVVLGNLYIGRVVQVQPSSSKVILPINVSSVLEVDIHKNKEYESKNLTEIQKLYTTPERKGVRGATRGVSSGIMIENIAKTSKVAKDDIVIINDLKVGQLLLLGKLGEVDNDPTKTEASAEVKTIVNYEELTYLFIYLND